MCCYLCIIENVTYPCSNFSTPCSGQGRCIDISEVEYRCICTPGYNGTDCEQNIDDCHSNPCFHGNCTDKVNGFNCSCDEGYDGVQCQISKYWHR